MLIAIEGLPDNGKTTLAVYYILRDYLRGRKIISNTPLFHIKYEEFDIDNFLTNQNEYKTKIRNATILLDEITMYMDCRLSASKSNLLMGYMMLQKRKRDLDIYYTTQDLDLVDYKRLVKYTDVIVNCQKIFTVDVNGVEREIKEYRNYTIIDLRRNTNNVKTFNLYIVPFFKYYDTTYIIEPLVKMNKKETKKNNDV